MSATGWPSFHPLRSAGTPLPPGLLVVAKALFVTSTLQGYVHRLPEPFLPFVPALDRIPHPALVPVALRTVVVIAGISLLLNRAVRASALVIGLVYGFALLSARGYYLNATVFLMCMFILIGLYEAPVGTRLVRGQFVVLYLGSTVNKLFEPDWRSGQYFEHWMLHIVGSAPYAALAAVLPSLWLARAMCWATIGIEATLAVLLAVRRWQVWGVTLAIAFHTAMVFLSGTTFGIFYSILLLSFPAFVCWPQSVTMEYDDASLRHRALRCVSRAADVDGRFRWVSSGGRHTGLIAQIDGVPVHGFHACAMWLLYSPAFYLSLAGMLALPALHRYLWSDS